MEKRTKNLLLTLAGGFLLGIAGFMLGAHIGQYPWVVSGLGGILIGLATK